MGDALSNGQAGAALLPHSLAIGAILFVMITLLGPVSGAHFNPAVTMVFALNGEMEQREAAPYVATQFLAGILGVLAAHLMFDLDIAQVSAKTRSGIGQWSAEVIATAGLIFVILGGAAHERRPHPGDGGALHHGGALVHGLDQLRQPGGHGRTGLHQHVLGHSAVRRARLHHRPVYRRASGLAPGARRMARGALKPGTRTRFQGSGIPRGMLDENPSSLEIDHRRNDDAFARSINKNVADRPLCLSEVATCPLRPLAGLVRGAFSTTPENDHLKARQNANP